MNYLKIYESLVEKAIARGNIRVKGETEYHHIRPTCKFPELKNLKECPWNGVHLTLREHFVAHTLLVKIYPDHRGLIHALNMMSNFRRYGSKKYAWLKKLNSAVQKSQIVSDATRLKQSLAKRGKPKSRRECDAISVRTGGENNPRARKIEVITPTGEILLFYGNFWKFVHEQKLPKSGMQKLLKGIIPNRGPTKLWRARYFD